MALSAMSRRLLAGVKLVPECWGLLSVSAQEEELEQLLQRALGWLDDLENHEVTQDSIRSHADLWTK